MLCSVILRARMGIGQKVVATERVSTVLALERQEVDEETGWGRALLPDLEKMGIALGCRRAGHGGGGGMR